MSAEHVFDPMDLLSHFDSASIEDPWEPEWDPPTIDPPAPHPEHPPHTLSARYDQMRADRDETTLFDAADSTHLNVAEHEAELCGVIGAAFGCLGHSTFGDLRSFRQLVEELPGHCNYSLEKVVRVMNRAQYKMHRAVADSFNVRTSCTTYHGTTLAASALITNTGFKGAACERALHGKGVYSSPDVWTALSFATPFERTRQVFFVVEYIQGPSAPGVQDQVDFGVDAQGQEILTLTSPDLSILCASRENQLLATHRITVRYMEERPYTQRHKDCCKVMHSHIVSIIKVQNKIAASAAAQVLAAASKASTVREVDATHDTYNVGDRVLVAGALKAYAEFVGCPGVIKRIVQGHHYFFCVLVDCPAKVKDVQDLNAQRVNKARFPFLKPDEGGLLCLKVGHIQKEPRPPSPSGAAGGASLGKRKAEAGVDKDGV